MSLRECLASGESPSPPGSGGHLAHTHTKQNPRRSPPPPRIPAPGAGLGHSAGHRAAAPSLGSPANAGSWPTFLLAARDPTGMGGTYVNSAIAACIGSAHNGVVGTRQAVRYYRRSTLTGSFVFGAMRRTRGELGGMPGSRSAPWNERRARGDEEAAPPSDPSSRLCRRRSRPGRVVQYGPQETGGCSWAARRPLGLPRDVILQRKEGHMPALSTVSPDR